MATDTSEKSTKGHRRAAEPQHERGVVQAVAQKGSPAEIRPVGNQAEPGEESGKVRIRPGDQGHDAQIARGMSQPPIGPPQTTANGRGFSTKIVCDSASGWSTTRSTLPPVAQAVSTCPSSCVAIIASHENAVTETISRA